MNLTEKKLVAAARKVREHACAKHTGFKVGAALLGKSGRIYTGANIESDVPSTSLCADRVALAHALSSGERKFTALAIVTQTEKAYPCGACRQMLFEFCGKNLKIIATNIQETHQEILTLGDLFPYPYIMK